MFPIARAYSAPINISAAFTAQIDIFELLAGTNKPLVIIAFELAQTTEVGDAQEEQLVLVLKRATGSVTSGSGGGTASFTPLSPNDGATGASCETGNTTKLAVGTGTITEVARFGWNVRTPLLYVPVPEERVIVDQATRLVLELATTPADSIGGIVGRLVIAELV